MKLRPLDSRTVQGYAFYCPGCEHAHIFYTAYADQKDKGKPRWDFDGNLESPTFTPSLLNTCEKHPDPKQRRCHLNLTAGKIYYHADSAHDLKGQTVDLPDRWPRTTQ
jgi:hypothetical protein